MGAAGGTQALRVRSPDIGDVDRKGTTLLLNTCLRWCFLSLAGTAAEADASLRPAASAAEELGAAAFAKTVVEP